MWEHRPFAADCRDTGNAKFSFMNSQLDKDFGSLPQRALGITEPDKHGHKEMQWDITIPQHDLNSTS